MIGPRCNRGEFVGELDPLKGQFEARVEEVGDRDSLATGGGLTTRCGVALR